MSFSSGQFSSDLRWFRSVVFPVPFPPVIYDEIQYAPDLLPFIKEMIDEDRLRTGQFLLTGSQNLLLMEKVTESLAGRVAMLSLLPLSRREVDGEPQLALPWEPERNANLWLSAKNKTPK